VAQVTYLPAVLGSCSTLREGGRSEGPHLPIQKGKSASLLPAHCQVAKPY